MQTHSHTYHSLILTPFFFLLLLSCSAAAPSQDLLRSSCSHARYPALCLQTLSTFAADPSATPLTLAQAAVTATLSRSRALSAYLATLQSQLLQQSPKRQRAAVTDCAAQISDSVDQLTRTLAELRRTRAGTASFEWHVSNAQTWTSAAMTDGSTCVDGFKGDDGDGKVREDVKRRVRAVWMLSSNALCLITRLGGGADNSHNNTKN